MSAQTSGRRTWARVAAVSAGLLLAGRASAEDWTPTWTSSDLSQPHTWLTAASWGNKALFAGGLGSPGNQNSPVVDIYDASTNSWSSASLSIARYGMTGTSAGGKVFFAGGFDYQSNNTTFSRVDIYDTATNNWSTAELSQTRSGLASASLGSKVFFAGGYNGVGATSLVDIYDTSTNVWTTAALSQPRSALAATTVGTKVRSTAARSSSVQVPLPDASPLPATATLRVAGRSISPTAPSARSR